MRKMCVILPVLILILSCFAYAAGEISMYTDRLNYWDSEQHTFTVSNDGNLSTTVVFGIPTGWSWVSGSGCTNPASTISCVIGADSSSTFTLSSPSSDAEYTTTLFAPASITNGYTESNNVTTLAIQPNEIFHTLVEFGRGRGNYFYDSGSSRSGSGKSREGCTYLPNGTMFELNFLHKVHNIQQYLGLPEAEGENATFTCTYDPSVTVVRKHLISSINKGASEWTIAYDLPEISSSWERMGYVGMDFDPADVPDGEQVVMNCTNLDYALPGGYGDVKVDYADLVFDVIDREPFSISASTGATIGNGTQEVEITYQITNNAPVGLDNVIIEIEAPQFATFIGTRGELWGTALDQYRIEKLELGAGATETITLVARFDTSAAGNISSLELSQGAKVSFVPCWEINAYNPGEYLQYLDVTDTASVNMGVDTEVVNLISKVTEIYNLVTEINVTTNLIDQTVNTINSTANRIEDGVQLINNTVNQINSTVTSIQTTVDSIYDDTQLLIDELNCNGTQDTPICDYVADINSTVTNIDTKIDVIENKIDNVNETLVSMNETMMGYFVDINTTVTNISGEVAIVNNRVVDLTDIVQNLVNCSYNDGNNSYICDYLQTINITVDNIETTTTIINGTVTLINTSVSEINTTAHQIDTNVIEMNATIEEFYDYMNNTVWENYTAKDLIDNLTAIIDIVNNITFNDTSIDEILVRISRLQEFSEEMVFLVTDSVVSQREARDAVASGDPQTAMVKLNEASAQLKKATQLMAEREAQLREAGSPDASEAVVSEVLSDGERISLGSGWLIPAFILIAIVVLGFYLFSRPNNPQF